MISVEYSGKLVASQHEEIAWENRDFSNFSAIVNRKIKQYIE